MLRDSIVRRSLAAFALLSALAIGGSALLAGAGLSNRNERERRDSLVRHSQQQLRAYEGTSRLFLDPASRGVAEKLVRADSDLIGLRITVFSPEGALLVDSAGGGPAGVERPEVAAAVASRTGYHRRYDALLRGEMRYAASFTSRPEGGGPPIVVRAGERVDQADAALIDGFRLLAWAALATWLICNVLLAAVVRAFWSRASALRLALTEPKAVFPRGSTGVFADIARRAESILDEARTLRRDRSTIRTEADAILASMSEAVLAVDADARLRIVNAAAARLLGLDPEAARGQPIGGVVRFEGIAETASRSAAGEVISRRAELPGPPARVLDLHAEPIRPGGGAVLVLRDVTEEARFAEMRRDFAAAASHELRTPLSVIKGMVETLLDGALDDKAKAREFLEAMDRQTRQLGALVNDLLDLGKLDARSELSPRACDLPAVLEAASAIHASAAAVKHQSIRIECSPDLPPLMADPALLERAFSNLIENAVRYTGDGGSISVRAARWGDGVRVEVQDTGIGIPEKDIKRIFERFYRVDRSRSRELGGTGLGLAIVKHIVQLHKGEVWAESGPGRGALFVVRLPGFGAGA